MSRQLWHAPQNNKRRTRPWQAFVRSHCLFFMLAGTFCVLRLVGLHCTLDEIYGVWHHLPGDAHPVCIVAGGRNKHRELDIAARSWVSLKGATQIVLVDWGSSPPYASSLSPLVANDPRLKLLAVSGDADFKITWAINLAAQFADKRCALLKVDADTALSPDFLAAHPLGAGQYYAGDYSKARTENEVHLNGIVHLWRHDFERIGGYDERIQTYGWDDTDLYVRLNSSGLQLQPLNLDTLQHITHGDGQRLTNRHTHVNSCPEFEISLNRRLQYYLPPWGARDAKVNYNLLNQRRGALQLAVVATTPSNLQLVAAKDAEEAQRFAAMETLSNFNLNSTWATEAAELPLPYLERLVGSYCSCYKQSSMQRMLIVHLQHGLGNRLRALASAIVLANKSGRWLRVISEPDIHFNVTMHELFDLEASKLFDVWDEFDYRELTMLPIVLYDYMSEKGKNARIDHNVTAHIYVRTAYRVVSDLQTAADEDAALRELVAEEHVLRLVQQVQAQLPATFAGVHIRALDPGVEFGVGAEQDMYSEHDWAVMTAHRSRTNMNNFLLDMLKMREKDSNIAFYVACDSQEGLDLLVTTVGNVLSLPRSCDDRSSACMQYALADLLLLGKATSILGSYWSSFSEIAGNLAGVQPVYIGDPARDDASNLV